MQFKNQLIDLPSLHKLIDHYPLKISPNSYVVDAIILMNQEQSDSCELANYPTSFPSSKLSKKVTSYVLVVEGTQLLGIFTIRDVLRLTALGMDLSRVKISEVMTQQLITLKQSDFRDILTVLLLLKQYQIHHLPIVDDEEKLVGIVTESGLLQELDLVKILGVIEDELCGSKQTESVWRGLTDELEQRVAERTVELVAANQSLQQEINERKQAEAALRESEERLTLALEAAKMGIWDWDITRSNYLWSPNMGPLYGLPSNTLCPNIENFLNLIHPEDRESFIQAVTCSIEQGSEFGIEYRAVWPDGSLHWLNSSGKVCYDETGQPTRMIGTTRDISERKQTAQQIYEQAALLDIATDAIFVRDFQMDILFWNQGAERIYGWQIHEALGKNLKDLFCSTSSYQQEAAALKAVIKYGSWLGELCKVTKFGQEIIVESRWTLMFDGEGHPKSILIVDTDITDKKQLQEQFFRTQRLESIGTLAGGIAHDINNILTPILGAAQILKGKFSKNPELHQQMLTIIENNAKRGATLVKQVLSFARGFKGERTIVQLRHLIGEIIQIARHTFPKSIEFVTQISEDLSAVSGDVTQLHQVIMNLVVNARDAMPEGGILNISAQNMYIDEAYTRMHLESKVGNYIVITIMDTGIGMSPSILERIFEPFFTTKEVSAGTGLGLSTVRGIIKSHDGFITVSSQVGQGSKFKIFLPAVEAPQNQALDQLEMPLGQGELILVVDDEAQIRDVATIILENHNYQTMTASNGIEAIALYAQHKQEISAVLMDMMMPEMDGITAIRTLQKIDPKVQVIASSGLSTTDVLPQADEMEVQAVLLKPYTANQLLQNLNDIFRMQNG
ncbi:PAS domain S-box protein [Anabaena lutea]|uniref:histidine kinase n=1 Tax=Anabaena lutea FACHB-196 TaxID=2692881 RepID=A0ABR8F9G2_9NOST|nr:PAS domain S-box protein [Anabaena lutea]MBD2566520.1 PAS domain S-box protein [Anabaena lutea FACHB-196]